MKFSQLIILKLAQPPIIQYLLKTVLPRAHMRMISHRNKCKNCASITRIMPGQIVTPTVRATTAITKKIAALRALWSLTPICITQDRCTLKIRN